eukprot:1848736-Pyramimonas_sp.AAC.1
MINLFQAYRWPPEARALSPLSPSPRSTIGQQGNRRTTQCPVCACSASSLLMASVARALPPSPRPAMGQKGADGPCSVSS